MCGDHIFIGAEIGEDEHVGRLRQVGDLTAGPTACRSFVGHAAEPPASSERALLPRTVRGYVTLSTWLTGVQNGLGPHFAVRTPRCSPGCPVGLR